MKPSAILLSFLCTTPAFAADLILCDSRTGGESGPVLQVYEMPGGYAATIEEYRSNYLIYEHTLPVTRDLLPESKRAALTFGAAGVKVYHLFGETVFLASFGRAREYRFPDEHCTLTDNGDVVGQATVRGHFADDEVMLETAAARDAAAQCKGRRPRLIGALHTQGAPYPGVTATGLFRCEEEQ